MSSPLDRIVARKREEVARAKATVPMNELRARCEGMPRARNFFRAVVDAHHHEESRVIAEVKRKSPSAGIIRADFDPVAIAQAYHHAGASAISCLTDEEDFGGHLSYIQRIRDAVPLPVLRKDFIVDEYQVWEARAAGADAILLIAEVLSEGEIIDLQILATELSMTTLVEVHSVENLLKVRDHIGFPHAGYSLLGINNRDLSTMTTSITHTFRLVELVENRDVLVSESGITSRDDLKRLREHGVNIALIGEYLMRQPEPGRALGRLLGEND
jgi:indole-3-glycerol phosphate synthase